MSAQGNFQMKDENPALNKPRSQGFARPHSDERTEN